MCVTELRPFVVPRPAARGIGSSQSAIPPHHPAPMGEFAAPASVRDEDHGYPLVAETIGMWRLTKGIGRGGMGEVYSAQYDFEHLFALHTPNEGREAVVSEIHGLPRAEQARLASRVLGLSLPADKKFAIKICNARTGTAGYKRFLQEAHLAQKLGDHPYIITVHWINGDDGPDGILTRLAIDRGRHRDLAFMVMDLAECTFQREKLTLGESVHIIRCIASALDHAHAQKIIHRDLKPENILGSIDHPYLTDFGIAKEIDGTDGLTRTGQIIGTLDYMSPEQATDAKNVDHRSDIYSLGVVLYEFTTRGHLPYAHKEDRDSCLSAIRSKNYEPKWPREHVPGFPAELERIILKAMAFERTDRYQTMAELISDLDRFTRGERIGWCGRITPRAMVRAQMRFHPRVLVGAITAAVVLLLTLAAVYIPNLVDETIRANRKNLERVAQATDQVVRGERMQLDADAADRLGKLRVALAGPKALDEQKAALTDIEQKLLAHRRLDLDFRAVTPGVDLIAELALASRANKPAWGLDKIGGLVLSQNQGVELKPYGLGTLTVQLTMTLPVGFNAYVFAVAEADDPTHRTWWDATVLAASASATGQPGMSLRLMHAQDMKPAVMLREDRLVGTRVSLVLELTAQGIRSRVGTVERSMPTAGLRDGAPAQVLLWLPSTAKVERLRVVPEAMGAQ